MPWIYLVLVAVVLVVGLGVVVLNRRRAAASSGVTTPHRPAVHVDDGPAAAPDEVASDVPLELERPNFRSRMSKARTALAGTLLSIRGRNGITRETWDDLEEAMLRADVGVRSEERRVGKECRL